MFSNSLLISTHFVFSSKKFNWSKAEVGAPGAWVCSADGEISVPTTKKWDDTGLVGDALSNEKEISLFVSSKLRTLPQLWVGWFVSCTRKCWEQNSASICVIFLSSLDDPVKGEHDGQDTLGRLKSPPISISGDGEGRFSSTSVRSPSSSLNSLLVDLFPPTGSSGWR